MKNIGILLACSLLLFGCGSTSDSSTGSAASSGSSGATYTGKTTPATITSGNAISLTGVVVQGAGSGAKLGSMFRSNAGVRSMSMLDAAVGVVATANEALTQQKQPKLAAGAVQTNTYTQNCAGQGTMTITESLDNVTGLGSVTLSFSNCGAAPDTINGSMSVNITAVDANNNNAPTSMSIQFDNLTVTDAVGTNYMNGTIGVSSTANTAGGTTDTLTMTFVMQESNGNIAKMDNFQYIANTDALGNMVSEEMSGRVYDSASGYVDITTTSPLVYSPAGSMYPSSGGPVIFAGANNTKVRITPVDSTNVLIEADTTGDGNYDFSQTKAWSAL